MSHNWRVLHVDKSCMHYSRGLRPFETVLLWLVRLVIGKTKWRWLNLVNAVGFLTLMKDMKNMFL